MRIASDELVLIPISLLAGEYIPTPEAEPPLVTLIFEPTATIFPRTSNSAPGFVVPIPTLLLNTASPLPRS